MFGMPSCKEVSRLVSESMDDQKLPFRKKLGLWMHLRLCRVCRGFVAQLRALREAATRMGSDSDPQADEVRLSTNARERIEQAMRDAGSN